MLKKDIRVQKNALREKMKEFRRSMPPAVKEKKDAAIRQNLFSLKQYQACQTLLTFVSSPIEVDTRVLIRQALQNGKRVAVPYCVEGTRQMEFYYIRSMQDLAPRTFGVLEPVAERCEKMRETSQSICIVPGLGLVRISTGVRKGILRSLFVQLYRLYHRYFLRGMYASTTAPRLL